MAPSPYIESRGFSAEERQRLVQLAHNSIAHQLQQEASLTLNLPDWPENLTLDGASFVTLKLAGKLRGCIGTIEPHRALVLDVSANAEAAAFHDPRFAPVSAAQVEELAISISVLSPAVAVEFASFTELYSILRPNVDGVILEAQGRRGVFLPQVWELLPDPADFLRQLQDKAGIPVAIAAQQLSVSRFQVEAF